MALGKGFVKAGLVRADGVLASDPLEAARTAFSKEVGARNTAANPDVLKFAEVLVLAVKPDQVAPLLAEVRSHFTEKHLLLSIAAGVTLSKLEGALLVVLVLFDKDHGVCRGKPHIEEDKAKRGGVPDVDILHAGTNCAFAKS